MSSYHRLTDNFGSEIKKLAVKFLKEVWPGEDTAIYKDFVDQNMLGVIAEGMRSFTYGLLNTELADNHKESNRDGLYERINKLNAHVIENQAKELSDKQAEIDQLKTSIERINGVVKWQQEYCLDYVHGFRESKRQHEELKTRADKMATLIKRAITCEDPGSPCETLLYEALDEYESIDKGNKTTPSPQKDSLEYKKVDPSDYRIEEHE